MRTRTAISLSLACAGLFYIMADRLGVPLPVSIIFAVAGVFTVRAIYLWLID